MARPARCEPGRAAPRRPRREDGAGAGRPCPFGSVVGCRLLAAGLALCAALLALGGCASGAASDGVPEATIATVSAETVPAATAATSAAPSTSDDPAALARAAQGATGPIPPSCRTPPNAADYVALAAHRQDVLALYAQNGWDTQAKCHQVFDDWLAQHPDGGPPTSAPAFVAAHGWLAPSGGAAGATTAAK